MVDVVEKTTVVADKHIDFNAFHRGVDEKTQLPNGFLYAAGKEVLDKYNIDQASKSDKNPKTKKELSAELLIEIGRVSILQDKAKSQLGKHRGLASAVKNNSALNANLIESASNGSLAKVESDIDAALVAIESEIEEECEDVSIVGAICNVVGGWFTSKNDCHDKTKKDPKLAKLAEKAKHHDNKHDTYHAKDDHLGGLFPNLYGAYCQPKKHGHGHDYNQ